MTMTRFVTACALSSAALTAQLSGAPAFTAPSIDPEVRVAVLHQDRLDFTVTSEVLPGVERCFASFSAADEEATESRIFAGVHVRNDLTTGQRLGRDVADFVLDHFLGRRHQEDKDGDAR